jgi:hypothetical protein
LSKKNARQLLPGVLLFLLKPILTRFVAFFAGVCTLLAMLVIVLSAFFLAQAANLDALLYHVAGMAGVTGHKPGSEGADIGAIAIKHDAFYHHFHIVLLQAHGGTGFAGGDALNEDVLEVVGFL